MHAMATQQGGGLQSSMPNPSSSSAAGASAVGAAGVGAGAAGAGGMATAPDAQNSFDFDVLATDLFSFFPLDMSAQQGI